MSANEINLPKHEDFVKKIIAKLASLVREKSAAYQLVTESELLSALNNEYPALVDANNTEVNLMAIMNQLILENEDLKRITGTGAPCYYSSFYMTEAYANILLHKLEGPLQLIAKTVRHDSSEYHRPVPIKIFTEQPFGLERGEILLYLKEMASIASYSDIATVTTSASGIYIYSNSYLGAEHAAMLAEWLDVGQFSSP